MQVMEEAEAEDGWNEEEAEARHEPRHLDGGGGAPSSTSRSHLE